MRNLAFVLVGVLAFAVWIKSRQIRATEASAAKSVAAAATADDEMGWTSVPMPADTSPGRVVVFSALNCPKAAAQRALVIVDDLNGRGIPCVHTDKISFPAPTPDEADRLSKVMNAGAPVVFVNGRAKSCPLVEEIVAEYHAASGR